MCYNNRRYLASDGSVRFDRTSSTRDAAARAAPENLIDPWLKTLSFWDGETPVVAVSAYAVHPMSYYGQGDIQFSNFPLIEDRVTHDLVLHITTYGQEPDPKDWATAVNYRYTIALRP